MPVDLKVIRVITKVPLKVIRVITKGPVKVTGITITKVTRMDLAKQGRGQNKILEILEVKFTAVYVG